MSSYRSNRTLIHSAWNVTFCNEKVVGNRPCISEIHSWMMTFIACFSHAVNNFNSVTLPVSSLIGAIFFCCLP